jgi:hypothetical protein
VRAWWLGVIAVGACGRIGFDAIGDGRIGNGDGNGSSMMTGSDAGYSGSGCLSPGSGDDFEEIIPCKAWGEPVVDNAGMNVSNGELTITPDASTQSAGGCLDSSLAFGEAGFFVHILQFPNPGELQLVITDTSTSTNWIIQSTNNLLFTFTKSGGGDTTAAFDASQVWWRLRPSGASVVYETSPDGESWTVQHTEAGAAPATVGASIEDVVDDPAPGVAILGGIDICP